MLPIGLRSTGSSESKAGDQNLPPSWLFFLVTFVGEACVHEKPSLFPILLLAAGTTKLQLVDSPRPTGVAPPHPRGEGSSLGTSSSCRMSNVLFLAEDPAEE